MRGRYTLFVLFALLCCLYAKKVTAETCTSDSWCKQDNVSGTITDSTYHLTKAFFLDNRTGWIGRSDGTIYRTTDGGSTWLSGKSFVNKVVALQFLNATEGWCADGSHIKHTTDGGATWAELYHDDAKDIAGMQFLSATLGYLASSFQNKLFKSTDGGVTWVEEFTASGNVDMIALDFYDETTGIVSGNSLACISRDGGATCTAANVSVNTARQFKTAAAISPQQFLVADSHLWRTVDGTTWDTAWNDGGMGFNMAGQACDDYFVNRCQYYSIRFVEDTPQAWLGGGQGHILKSTDNGAKWYTTASGTTETITDITAPDTSFAVAVGSRGTLLFHRPEAGPVDGNQDINASVTVGTLILTVGQNGKLSRSTDGGTTWTLVSTGLTNHFNDIKSTSATNFLVAGNDGLILRSTDAGLTWKAAYTGVNDNLQQIAVSGSKAWVIGNGGVILATIDAGETFNQQDGRVVSDLNGISSIDGAKLFVVGDAGVVLSTTNGGDSWSLRTKVTEANLNSVSFASATTGTIVGDGSLTMTTADGGTTWTVATATAAARAADGQPVADGGADPLANAKIRSVAHFDAQNAWAVGDAGLVLRTQNGGKTWDMYGVPTPYNLKSVTLTGPNAGTITGGQGVSLRIPDDVTHLTDRGLAVRVPPYQLLLGTQ